MTELGNYIYSLTAVSLICAAILLLSGKGSGREVIRMVCGVFLAVTALAPLRSVELTDWEIYLEDPAARGQQESAYGAEMAEDAIRQSISARLEAYILDKAKALGENITCSVSLGQDRYPNSVTVWGDISEENRQHLSDWITEVLGIAKENQQWIGKG